MMHSHATTIYYKPFYGNYSSAEATEPTTRKLPISNMFREHNNKQLNKLCALQ